MSECFKYEPEHLQEYVYQDWCCTHQGSLFIIKQLPIHGTMKTQFAFIQSPLKAEKTYNDASIIKVKQMIAFECGIDPKSWQRSSFWLTRDFKWTLRKELSANYSWHWQLGMGFYTSEEYFLNQEEWSSLNSKKFKTRMEALTYLNQWRRDISEQNKYKPWKRYYAQFKTGSSRRDYLKTSEINKREFIQLATTLEPSL